MVTSTKILQEIVLNVTETFCFSEYENQTTRKQQKMVSDLLLCFYTQLFPKTSFLFLKQLNRNYKDLKNFYEPFIWWEEVYFGWVRVGRRFLWVGGVVVIYSG